MSKYIPVLQQLLNELYPREKSSEINNVTITNIQFQKIYLPTCQHLELYYNITSLCICYCDLRTLKNFPTLPQLSDLDISHNGLQGTFEYLLRNKSLQYINASNNLISDPINILPLKKFRKMSICLKDNPICSKQNWSTKMKPYIKILKQPKKNTNSSKSLVKNEHIQPKQIKNNNHRDRTDNSPSLFGLHGYRFAGGKFIVSYANDDPNQRINDPINFQLKRSANRRQINLNESNRPQLQRQLSDEQDQLDGFLEVPGILYSSELDIGQQQNDDNDQDQEEIEDSSSSEIVQNQQ